MVTRSGRRRRRKILASARRLGSGRLSISSPTAIRAEKICSALSRRSRAWPVRSETRSRERARSRIMVRAVSMLARTPRRWSRAWPSKASASGSGRATSRSRSPQSRARPRQTSATARWAGPVGMQPPDDQGQERRPQAARREHQHGGGGLRQGQRPVEGDAQHDHQHVAGRLRLHAPDPGIRAGEDQRAGDRDDDGEPQGLDQAEPGPEQAAQDREGGEDAQPRPHRPAIVAEAGEVGGERHGEQGRPLHPDVDQDDDAEREGGAHALHEPHARADRGLWAGAAGPRRAG